jgi:hypothetical protein
MPATKPRPGLPADIKFNPANGSRAELDADGVMARLEAGVTRRKAFQGLGGHRLFALYCAANPEWAARADALLARNAEAAHKNKGSTSKRKDPTRCGRGHDLRVPGNSRHNVQNGKPYLECKVCARENAKFRGKLMSPEKRLKVMQAFARKGRFETIKRFCDTNSFYRQLRRDPEFAAAHEQWLVGYRERQGKRLKVILGKRRYAKIDSAVPKALPTDVRHEIISMIFLALRTRSHRGKGITLTKLSDHVRAFVSDYYKVNPAHGYGKIDSPWSLDDIVPGTDGLKRIDTISEGLW